MTSPKAAADLDGMSTGELAESPHYLDQVAMMADAAAITAANDIVSDKGIKLVAKGHRLDARLRDKLAGHSLREPLDRELAVADGVTAEKLSRAAAECIEREPWWHHLAARSGDPLAMCHGLARLKIPAAVCFNLTLAREQRPTLYRHSLRVALLCHYLAIRLELLPSLTDKLLLAALCHDLGELHIDPALLAPDHRITGEERRFVHAHPITGYLILRDIDGIDGEVARTVLHHHERLDGSGYPSGLKGEAIAPLSRILMIADVAESILARYPDRRRLSTLLQLNLKKYDGKTAALLHDALGPTRAAARRHAEHPGQAGGGRLAAVAGVLAGWSSLRKALDDPTTGNAQSGAGFLFALVHELHSMLLQFGFNPDDIDGLAKLAEDDAEIASELESVLDELQFHLFGMHQEIERRGDSLTQSLPAGTGPAFAQWRQTLRAAVAAG